MMGMHDWIYYCLDNQITRGAAGYVVKIAESVSGAQSTSKTVPPPTQVATAIVKPLWQQTGHSHNFLRIAAISGSAAVCLGAYGAHRHWGEADDKHKDDIDHRKKQFEVANHYHFYHTLALMAVPLSRFPIVSGALFTTGIVLFCGPIYYSSVSGDKTYNRLTPFGGVSFIIAWLSLVL